NRPGVAARQRRQHPAPHVVDVGGALGQQPITEAAPLRGSLFAGGVPGGLRRVAAVDQPPRPLQQRLVVEQGNVGREDLGLLRRTAPSDRVTVVLDGFARRGQRRVEAAALDVNALRSPRRWRTGQSIEVTRGSY